MQAPLLQGEWHPCRYQICGGVNIAPYIRTSDVDEAKATHQQDRVPLCYGDNKRLTQHLYPVIIHACDPEGAGLDVDNLPPNRKYCGVKLRGADDINHKYRCEGPWVNRNYGSAQTH